MILLVLLFLVTAAILILDQTKFYYFEALESDYVKFEIHGCGGFREKSFRWTQKPGST